jgi:hypothetical protein
MTNRAAFERRVRKITILDNAVSVHGWHLCSIYVNSPHSRVQRGVQEENMVTRGELAEKYTSAQDYEEDFM